ncbi:hypothetical protein CCACVL1_29227 [Corchorus capsularis]|uniref:Uncharacterized protein n=1 Tax=Corchorus capsularis TaxID=210143 RepID=A0A1R3G2X1_COCAP|nr:hypothetical protein CCACVL1_29227 [Corchorus capsularis]
MEEIRQKQRHNRGQLTGVLTVSHPEAMNWTCPLPSINPLTNQTEKGKNEKQQKIDES